MRKITQALALFAGASLLVCGLGAGSSRHWRGRRPAKEATSSTAVDPTVSPPGWVAPKNAMGQPDLSGYWSNATMTPLNRSPKLTDRLVISAAQAASLEKVFAQALAAADAPTDQKKGHEASSQTRTRLRRSSSSSGPILPTLAATWAATTPSGSIRATT